MDVMPQGLLCSIFTAPTPTYLGLPCYAMPCLWTADTSPARPLAALQAKLKRGPEPTRPVGRDNGKAKKVTETQRSAGQPRDLADQTRYNRRGR